ncbi:MAG: exodeoxyribonuclease VII large subunit [Clostridium sp.]|nr:exodeoxyribonuclease VII large subunit [Clostridium sp.]
MDQALTLQQLQLRVKQKLASPDLQNVWITAELSDVRVSGGHCYMELLQKDDAGRILAKSRAAIWANVYSQISRTFRAATGQDFATNLKVMLRVSVSYHEVYGMTVVVSAVNPEFTMGELLRRRRENILRLQREGILNANRELPSPALPLRVAIISAAGAAGFGDFVNQIVNNPSRLAFRLKLFPARLQGEGTPASIIAALTAIMAEYDNFDCVVLIRGGGATSDLLAFEDYDLAASIAQFPLPVIIGIGHERDVTLLDYVAHMRVKTPTAAAEWLIGKGEAALDRLRRAAVDLQRISSDRMAGENSRLATLAAQLKLLPARGVEQMRARLERAAMAIHNASSLCIAPTAVRLDSLADSLRTAALRQIERRSSELDKYAALIGAYSPDATLRRGFTMTLSGGRIVRSAADILPGAEMTTRFADGEVCSTVSGQKLNDIKINNKQ